MAGAFVATDGILNLQDPGFPVKRTIARPVGDSCHRLLCRWSDPYTETGFSTLTSRSDLLRFSDFGPLAHDICEFNEQPLPGWSGHASRQHFIGVHALTLGGIPNDRELS
jgi:hypothetical protein